MKFTGKRSEVVRAAELAAAAVETKTTIPILGHFRVVADSAHGVTLSATDLELAVIARFAAEVDKPGAATVPAKRFLAILKALPEGEVSVEALENHWVHIKGGKARFKLAGVAPESFPVLPQIRHGGAEGAEKPTAGPLQFPASAFGEAIRKVAFAISREESRYTLNGALLIVRPDGIALVATDGHRLATADAKFQIQDCREIRTLVPKNALGVLAALIDKRGEAETVGFAQDESHLFFSLGARQLISRRLTGQFPNYEAVLPVDNKSRATVDAAALGRAVQRVALLADERAHAIKLELSKGKIRLSAAGGAWGEAQETVDAEYDGEDIAIGFNFLYLQGFLGVASGKVTLALKDESSAVELTSDGDAGYRYVLMPMRV